MVWRGMGFQSCIEMKTNRFRFEFNFMQMNQAAIFEGVLHRHQSMFLSFVANDFLWQHQSDWERGLW